MTGANQAHIYMKPIAGVRGKTIKVQKEKNRKIMSAIRQTMTLGRDAQH